MIRKKKLVMICFDQKRKDEKLMKNLSNSFEESFIINILAFINQTQFQMKNYDPNLRNSFLSVSNQFIMLRFTALASHFIFIYCRCHFVAHNDENNKMSSATINNDLVYLHVSCINICTYVVILLINETN